MTNSDVDLKDLQEKLDKVLKKEGISAKTSLSYPVQNSEDINYRITLK
jgi:hypothetical protein